MGTRRTVKSWQCLAVGVMGLALAACGGSGGGGASAVTYAGATTQAAVTNENAEELATTAYQGGNSGGSFALVGVVTDSADGSGSGTARALTVARVLEDAVRAARFSADTSPQVAVGATQSVSGQLDPGTCGGTASYSGTMNDVTGAISATFTFSAWCNDGVTVSGRVTASGTIDVDAGELVELEFSFTVLTVSDGTDEFSGTGTITASFGTNESMTIDMDFRGTDGVTFRVTNLVLTVTPTVDGENLTIEGRFYHPVHGYVDVTTPQALAVVTGDVFPSSGEILVSGSSGSKARLTALSSTEFQVEVDADGDDAYETTLGPLTWGAV